MMVSCKYSGPTEINIWNQYVMIQLKRCLLTHSVILHMIKNLKTVNSSVWCKIIISVYSVCDYEYVCERDIFYLFHSNRFRHSSNNSMDFRKEMQLVNLVIAAEHPIYQNILWWTIECWFIEYRYSLWIKQITYHFVL